MKRPHDPSEGLHNHASSQRNLVFPDTVRNEFRGYDRLLHGPKLNTYQKIGVMLIAPIFLLMGLGIVAASIFIPRWAANQVRSAFFGAAMIPLSLVMAGIGIAFAVFGIKLLKRALLERSSPDKPHANH